MSDDTLGKFPQPTSAPNSTPPTPPVQPAPDTTLTAPVTPPSVSESTTISSPTPTPDAASQPQVDSQAEVEFSTPNKPDLDYLFDELDDDPLLQPDPALDSDSPVDTNTDRLTDATVNDIPVSPVADTTPTPAPVNSSTQVASPPTITAELLDTTPTTTASIDSPVLPPAPSYFEDTPDEVPTIEHITTTPADIPQDIVQASQESTLSDSPPLVATPSQPTAADAASFSKPKLPVVPLVITAFVLVTISTVAFLVTRANTLRNQVEDLNRTINQQTTVTPTLTSTPSEIIPTSNTTPTPIITLIPTATPSVTPILSPTITSTPATSLLNLKNPPLSMAEKVLQTGLKYKPAAQLILIKTDNAHDSTNYSVKYYFRYSLSDKRYFYIITSNGIESELVDSHITVTPDNNIPSINESILGGKTGIDLNEAHQIAMAACTTPANCQGAQVKAQYINTSDKYPLWQIHFVTSSKESRVQVNAISKAILYKSVGF